MGLTPPIDPKGEKRSEISDTLLSGIPTKVLIVVAISIVVAFIIVLLLS